MRRELAAASLVLATLALSACARTRDVYVGSDLGPDAPPPEASGGPAPMPPPDAGAADDTGAGEGTGAVGAAGATGGTGSAGSAGSAGSTSSLPPAAFPDAATPSACVAGTADCDASAANGCETDVTSDRMHCGDCGVACQSVDCVCVDGALVLACPAGRADCDADASNGCETSLSTDEQHCGQCGQLCSDTGAGVASATCSAGVCVLACSSPTLRGDCDGEPDNGCEVDLFHDANNCSACGVQCNGCLDGRCL